MPVYWKLSLAGRRGSIARDPLFPARIAMYAAI